MKKLTRVTMNKTTLVAVYDLDNSQGWPKIKNLKIFPKSAAEELTGVLNPGAMILMRNGIAEAINEDYDDMEF